MQSLRGRRPARVVAGCVLLVGGMQGNAWAEVPGPTVTPALSSDGQVVVLSRYTSTAADPPAELAEPLQVVVSLSYPRGTVSTVGDAIRHTLARSGYRLSMDAAAPDAATFLQLPLPESQRQIGPYRVQSVLDVLLGSAWQWHSDPRSRAVWFSATGHDAAQAAPLVQAIPTHSPGAATSTPVREAQLNTAGTQP